MLPSVSVGYSEESVRPSAASTPPPVPAGGLGEPIQLSVPLSTLATPSPVTPPTMAQPLVESLAQPSTTSMPPPAEPPATATLPSGPVTSPPESYYHVWTCLASGCREEHWRHGCSFLLEGRTNGLSRKSFGGLDSQSSGGPS
ncbi:proline-rich protein 36-like [Oreochromis niloticus]|uniref:proline-rich protein 36-like n=1 Tax=Oreochromis niloticus TaxID=8128 RepID=UPI000DF21D4C|nr:proline-rich protein 36-like [Oreochromis niloticus]